MIDIDEDAITARLPAVPRPAYVRASIVIALVFGPWIVFAIAVVLS